MKAIGKFAAFMAMAAAAFRQKDSTVLKFEARETDMPSIGSPVRFSGGSQYHSAGSGRSRKAKPNRKHHSSRARNRARRK